MTLFINPGFSTGLFVPLYKGGIRGILIKKNHSFKSLAFANDACKRVK
jgi:hypothetical protein